MQKNCPTDVISFLYEKIVEKDLIKECWGDVFISVDTAMRQAKDAKWSLHKELELLTTHGILHLFGFDDLKEKNAVKMQEMERKILEER